MVLPVPRKRAFRNVFQSVRGKVYKSRQQQARRGGQTQRRDEAQNARLQRLRRGSMNLSDSRIYLIINSKSAERNPILSVSSYGREPLDPSPLF